MIRRLTLTHIKILLACLILANLSTAFAQEPQPPRDPLELHEVPVPLLYDRVLGTTARPVVIDWRKRSVMLGLGMGHILELNNFQSDRYKLDLNFPGRWAMFELATAYVSTQSTASTELISRTPYRQTGRPNRFELETGITVPLAEGISTFMVNVLPSAQLVFSGQFKLRYLFYPDSFKWVSFSETMVDLLKFNLTSGEQERLKQKRPAGMYIDSRRYNALIGTRGHIIGKSGIFIVQDILVGLPLMFREEKDLAYWWDMSFGVGYVF